jgi:Jacalin-like lectin domain
MMLLFGKPHPQSKVTEITLEADAGEIITGFAVRAGEWVDAIKVITNKKESAWLGDDRNTRTFQMKPPQGYEIIGIYGQIGICCDGFGVVYTSNT